MRLKQLHYPHVEMRVAGFMSGSGTNLVKIIEYSKQKKQETGKLPYNVVMIFTDDITSKAMDIGKEYDIPVLARDKKGFYKARNAPVMDMKLREEFDAETHGAMLHFDVNVLAFAGYMSIATAPLINTFLAVNVHPADLTILDKDGKRKYTGDNAVRDAILAGEKYLASTTHIVEEKVDEGPIMMVSPRVKVEIKAQHPEDLTSALREVNIYEGWLKIISQNHQNELKEKGDWKIFPKTLELISQGRYQKDESGNLYFDEMPIPNGIKYEDLR